jgi:hypothetical protein
VNVSRHSKDYGEDLVASATEQDLVMLINGLERLVLLGLAYTSEAEATDDDASIQEKVGNESSGLLGYVSTVFSSDGGAALNEQSTVSRLHFIQFYRAHLYLEFAFRRVFPAIAR